MKSNKKRLFIVTVIAAIVAIVSLCSVVLFGNKNKDLAEFTELAGGTPSAETTREVVIEDTTFTSGTFTVESGSNVTIKNCTFTGSTTGAIEVKSKSTLNLERCTFVDNTKVGSGAGIYADNATVTINNCVFDGQISQTSGGAIYALNSELTIKGDSIIKNCSTLKSGGAIYQNGGTFTMSGGNIVGNTALYGGGIFNSGGTLTIEGGQISGNTAYDYGGGIYLYESDDTSSEAKELTLNNCSINGNSADYEGAGVWVNNAILTINGASINGNTITTADATGVGAGIFATGAKSEVIITSGSVSENEINTPGGVSYGAGVYCDEIKLFDANASKGVVEISGNKNNGEEGSTGGGLYLQETNSSFGSSSAPDSSKVNISGNYSYAAGGFFANGSSSKSITMNIYSATIEENNAVSNGGACYLSYYIKVNIEEPVQINRNFLTTDGTVKSMGGAISSQHNVKIDINGATFSGNYIINDKKIDSTSIYGCAIEARRLTKINFNSGIIENSYTASSHLTPYGVAVSVRDGSVFRMFDGTITGSETRETKANNGGAIYAEGSRVSGTTTNYSTVEISGGKISGFSANRGAGVYVSAGMFSMTGGEISGNIAKYGGGIYLTSLKTESVISGNANIAGNTAEIEGGGICLASGTLLLGTDEVAYTGVITGNAATNGGGIWSSGTISHNSGTIGGDLILGDTTFTKNTATSGGVYIAGGNYNLYNGNINSNSGPGVYCTRGEFAMSGGSVYGNTGYGVYCHNIGNFTMSGGSIYGNSGGGVCVVNKFNMSGGIIYGNSGHGIFICSTGAVCVISGDSNIVGNTDNGVYVWGGTLSLGTDEVAYTGVITGNAATYGGGIYSYGTVNMHSGTIGGRFTLDGITYTGNTALFGGGVYVSDNDYGSGTFTMSGGNILGNKATSGGGVYINSGEITFTMEGGKISGNTAEYYGGGIYNKNEMLTLDGGEISGNTATQNGGGVWSTDAVLTINGASINENIITSDKNSGRGAGIFAIGTKSEVIITVGSINGNKIKTSSHVSYGAGVYCESIKLFDANASKGVVSISGNTNNGAASSIGGGLYLDTTPSSFGSENIAKENVVISGNYSYIAGGFYANGFVTMNIFAATISGNNAINHGGACYLTNGVALNLEENVEITENFLDVNGTSKSMGAAISAHQNVKVNINGATFSGNFAKSSLNQSVRVYGCAIDARKTSEVNFNSGLIEDSYSASESLTLYGSAISIRDGGILNMSGGEIKGIVEKEGTDKYIARDGGAIYAYDEDSEINITGGIISGNKAQNRGGGVFVYYGKFYMENGVIRENNANYGGGLYIISSRHENIIKDITEDMEDDEDRGFYNNSANIAGGGVSIADSKFTLGSGASIGGNYIKYVEDISTPARGGGLFVNVSELIIDGASISDNYIDECCPGGLGGGIYSHAVENKPTSITFNSGTISYNYANPEQENSAGGNVFVNDYCTFEMNGGTISGTGCDDDPQAYLGGGIASVGVVIINDGTIENCVAVHGGGIGNYGGITASIDIDGKTETFESFGELTLNGGIIQGCTATGIGDSIASGQDITISESFATSGEIALGATVAGALYGAIYPTIEITSSTVENEFSITFFQAEFIVDLDDVELSTYKITKTDTMIDEYYVTNKNLFLFGDVENINNFKLPSSYDWEEHYTDGVFDGYCLKFKMLNVQIIAYDYCHDVSYADEWSYSTTCDKGTELTVDKYSVYLNGDCVCTCSNINDRISFDQTFYFINEEGDFKQITDSITLSDHITVYAGYYTMPYFVYVRAYDIDNGVDLSDYLDIEVHDSLEVESYSLAELHEYLNNNYYWLNEYEYEGELYIKDEKGKFVLLTEDEILVDDTISIYASYYSIYDPDDDPVYTVNYLMGTQSGSCTVSHGDAFYIEIEKYDYYPNDRSIRIYLDIELIASEYVNAEAGVFFGGIWIKKQGELDYTQISPSYVNNVWTYYIIGDDGDVFDVRIEIN